MALKKELEEYGFLTEHIELATKLSEDKEEVVNMLKIIFIFI
jgi:hypothetical protein